jgi:hypothetical protein
MPVPRRHNALNTTVTAWDFIKDNDDPDDRLAVVIKNPHENRVT